MLGNALRAIGRPLLDHPRGRAVHGHANRAASRIVGSRVRTGPAAGLTIHGGGTVGYALGISEPAIQQALVDHLRPGDTFWDVGAHVGFMAALACRLVGPSGTVHCFEPDPANITVLERNLAANAFTNVTVHPLAALDHEGTVRFAAGDHAIRSVVAGDGTLEVPAARLDALGLSPPRMVKIDVEGAESQVLDGMTGILPARPILAIEIHGSQDQAVRERLATHGYNVETVDDGGMPHLIAV